MIEIQIFLLVSKIILPVTAPAGTRPQVPPGYGVQEHCLPFTAATALGFLIKSPIALGICSLPEVPPNGHTFRSPVKPSLRENAVQAPVFYVSDANCAWSSPPGNNSTWQTEVRTKNLRAASTGALAPNHNQKSVKWWRYEPRRRIR